MRITGLNVVRYYALLFACLTGTAACEEPISPTHSPTRPNVILILADDLALGDFASNNGGMSHTPNLDRLAQQSVRFRQAYSASCVCAPARAALLTGRYPHRTGVVTLNMNRYPHLTRIRLDETTIADVMKAAEYTTALIGKWHCGIGEAYHPNQRGFDEFEGFSGSQELSYFRYQLDINGKPEQVVDDYLTDDLSRRAIAMVRRHRDRPFFLHLAHYAPHRPLEAPRQLIDSYIEKGVDESTATIYAMIEVMDRGIGELLSELERLKIAENTIVIFASDNGPDPLTGNRFNQDLRGMKYEVYEGGIRVPLLVRWPGVFEPGDRDQLVHFVDLFPTILDLCDVQYDSKLPLDGSSLAGVLRDRWIEHDRTRFWQWNRGVPNYTHNAAMREGPWKLVRPYVNRGANPKDSTQQPVLYHVADDPKEAVDRSDQERARYTTMLRKLDDWSESVERSRIREASPPTSTEP
ncbi:MAG: arylsulfatase [Pirellulaceae bacterium]|nr:arylsulfatase [Pirellulaceae bacterium]